MRFHLAARSLSGSALLFLLPATPLRAEVRYELRNLGRATVSYGSAMNAWSGWRSEYKAGFRPLPPPGVALPLLIDFDEDGRPELLISGNLFNTYASTRNSGELAAIEKPPEIQNRGSMGWAFFPGQAIGDLDLLKVIEPQLEWFSDTTAGGASGIKSGGNLAPIGNDGGYFHWRGGEPEPRFLGIRFRIDGRWHYGWVMFFRADGIEGDALPVGGWAYETEPDKPIIAGLPWIAAGEGRPRGTAGSLAAFQETDLDGDGVVSLPEYSRAQPVRSRRVRAMWRFHAMDVNGDEAVTEAEYRLASGGSTSGALPLAMAYLLTDWDRDGLVQAGEYPLWHPEVGHPFKQINVLKDFDRLDKTGEPRGSVNHGVLTPEEFGVPPALLRSGAKSFESLDADRDGKVTAVEFSGLPGRGRTLCELRETFRLVDVDRNGWLKTLELTAALELQPVLSPTRVFQLADADGGGTLDSAEFANTLAREAEWTTVMRRFAQADRDGNGELAESEWRRAAKLYR